jgi:hypothetical protein
VLEHSPHPFARYRSLEFFRELIRTPSLLSSLDADQRAFVCVGVRDLWLADSQRLLSSEERHLLSSLLDDVISDEVFASGELQHVGFSFCPTGSRRVLKFVSRLEEIVDEAEVLDCAAQLRLRTGGGGT